MQGLEARLVDLAGDVLSALGRGEIAADAPVVRAAAAALAELRRPPETSSSTPSLAPPARSAAAGLADPQRDAGGRGARAAAPAVEQLLAVAALMRSERSPFAAACALAAERLGSSPQAVRNACTRWLGVAAADWQPLLIDGAQAGVLPLARAAAERCPWLTDRIAREFGVPVAALGTSARTA